MEWERKGVDWNTNPQDATDLAPVKEGRKRKDSLRLVVVRIRGSLHVSPGNGGREWGVGVERADSLSLSLTHT